MRPDWSVLDFSGRDGLPRREESHSLNGGSFRKKRDVQVRVRFFRRPRLCREVFAKWLPVHQRPSFIQALPLRLVDAVSGLIEDEVGAGALGN